MNPVSMDKMYTLDGEVFTILTVTKPGNLPVLGYSLSGISHDFRADGSSPFCCLVEISPYADFVIDDLVMVRDNQVTTWTRALFVKANNGIGRIEAASKPAWIRCGHRGTSWDQCRRPTAEELAS